MGSFSRHTGFSTFLPVIEHVSNSAFGTANNCSSNLLSFRLLYVWGTEKCNGTPCDDGVSLACSPAHCAKLKSAAQAVLSAPYRMTYWVRQMTKGVEHVHIPQLNVRPLNFTTNVLHFLQYDMRKQSEMLSCSQHTKQTTIFIRIFIQMTVIE